jgi:hypothetical protein
LISFPAKLIKLIQYLDELSDVCLHDETYRSLPVPSSECIFSHPVFYFNLGVATHAQKVGGKSLACFHCEINKTIYQRNQSDMNGRYLPNENEAIWFNMLFMLVERL